MRAAFLFLAGDGVKGKKGTRAKAKKATAKKSRRGTARVWAKKVEKEPELLEETESLQAAVEETAETEVAEGKQQKAKKAGRRSPRTTLRENLPEIAVAMAERAKAGSYLHARALQDIVEAADAKRGRTRGEKQLARELIERLERLSCGCGAS